MKSEGAINIHMAGFDLCGSQTSLPCLKDRRDGCRDDLGQLVYVARALSQIGLACVRKVAGGNPAKPCRNVDLFAGLMRNRRGVGQRPSQRDKQHQRGEL